MGIAFFFIKRTYEADHTRTAILNGGPVTWRPVILKYRLLRWVVAVLFTGMNLMVLIESPRGAGEPARWLWPVAMISILAGAVLLWSMLRIIEAYSTSTSPIEIRIVKDGPLEKDPQDQTLLNHAIAEGNSRIIVYEVRRTLPNPGGELQYADDFPGAWQIEKYHD
jgi:hypothetical protein